MSETTEEKLARREKEVRALLSKCGELQDEIERLKNPPAKVTRDTIIRAIAAGATDLESASKMLDAYERANHEPQPLLIYRVLAWVDNRVTSGGFTAPEVVDEACRDLLDKPLVDSTPPPGTHTSRTHFSPNVTSGPHPNWPYWDDDDAGGE
ncbi:MAG: hypothetical protein B7733_00145 [Myxococcales bacterium FL481]|nr:MAG: hypothetical protein B7733_00145 [Myxococcales bacterium FL481]